MIIEIGIIGSQGKMGTRILACAKKDPNLLISWEATSSKEPPKETKVDAIIDFSSPLAFIKNLTYALKNRTPLVIGTTGLQEQDKETLKEASLHIPVLWSANFSLGMTAMTYVSEILATLLQRNFSSEVLETHHVHKKDSPSGSALVLAEALEKGSSVTPPIKSIRTGEVIGDHSVFFLGDYEKITLKHEALSRDAFAFGALQAAKFLAKAPPGLYQAKDIFGSVFKK